jgi:plastocyanin
MERIYYSLVALGLLVGGAALAEPVFNASDEMYPESSFGRAPAREHIAREVDDMDDPRFEAGLRMPASDVIRSTTSKATTKNAVVSSNKGVQEVALIANDLGFFPKTIFVNRDIPVRLFVTGASKNTLCIMMDSFQVRKQLRSQKVEEITFTPSEPGKYRFYCPVNGMEGSMVVRELVSDGRL